MQLAKYVTTKRRILNGKASFIVIKCNMNIAYTFTFGNVGMRVQRPTKKFTMPTWSSFSAPLGIFRDMLLEAWHILKVTFTQQNILYIWVPNWKKWWGNYELQIWIILTVSRYKVHIYWTSLVLFYRLLIVFGRCWLSDKLLYYVIWGINEELLFFNKYSVYLLPLWNMLFF